ncbi:MAG: carbamoyltransferase HypF [Pirellulaceae bacterium]
MAPSYQRHQLQVHGVVQGVGFRPFVFGLAERWRLAGFVRNCSWGVLIEIEGPADDLEQFLQALYDELPPLARLDAVERIVLPLDADPVDTTPSRHPNANPDTVHDSTVHDSTLFAIEDSQDAAGDFTSVSPDVATCDACLTELFDPSDRRYRYPFINCTHCGPRFTIICDIPYDRPFTTMADFPMCAACRQEYDDPRDRRFHAQPNACPVCGPAIWFVDSPDASNHSLRRPTASVPIPLGDRAIERFIDAMFEGKIVAVKGIGGFHLACDASSDMAVALMRLRKGRGEKPLAVMVRDLDAARRYAHVSPREAQILCSRQRPIVLLRPREKGTQLSRHVAYRNGRIGLMLPYSPLHHLLVQDRPLVFTSGNLSDEPIVRTNEEAITRLSPLADAFLLHDRDIHAVCDDSVALVIGDTEIPVRRSRGYAPLPVALPCTLPSLLAVGAELKSTFCLTRDQYVFMSQHIGDMENIETIHAFQRALDHLSRLFRVAPMLVACDLHPDYLSTRVAEGFAQQRSLPLVRVQHHHAHIAAVLAEHQLPPDEQVIGVCFDGTGFGTDGTIWGGEFLLADAQRFQRLAHLRPVPIPGGDAATRLPYRTALAYLHAAGLPWVPQLPSVKHCDEQSARLLQRQLERRLNCVAASSMGRLFDAVSSLIGLCHVATYEAQAAMELESAALTAEHHKATNYAIEIDEDARRHTMLLEWQPLLSQLCHDVQRKVSPSAIALGFHRAVANATVEVCRRIASSSGLQTVALSGGVFQNLLLTENITRQLAISGFHVLTHRLVPPNDAGLSLGQAFVAGTLATARP